MIPPLFRSEEMREGIRTVSDLVTRGADMGFPVALLVVAAAGQVTVMEPDELVLVGPEPYLDDDVMALGIAPIPARGNGVPTLIGAVAGTPQMRLGGRALGLRELGGALSPLSTELLSTAASLTQWHARHRFCPACGSETDSERGGWVRRCRNEGSEHYPRTDPAVIVLVHDGQGRCLLGRKPEWPAGRYSCLAGFVEPGESAEAAVVREVAEESGVAVRDVLYRSSQHWPFPGSLMIAFTALADPDAPARADGIELEDVRWFSADEVAEPRGAPVLPPPASVAHRLIHSWLAEVAGRYE